MTDTLFDHIASVPSLFAAWRKVRANRGAAGIDAVSILQFEKNLNANLNELSRNLINKTYEPLPARHVNIPKSNGKERELAIPTVRDRIAQRAVLDSLEPLFEPKFLDCSFAFRPGRSVAMAIHRIVVARAQGFCWTVDADIEDFFPSIDHRLLFEDLAREIPDSEILSLIKQWLDAGLLYTVGPQSSTFSGLRSSLAAANLAVRDGLDNLLNEFVSDRLGLGDYDSPEYESVADDDDSLTLNAQSSAKSQTRRAALRRLVQDGALLALVERTALRRLMTPAALGIGGVALAVAALTPAIARRAREAFARKSGALQGAPLSPLLSNIFLHPLDVALTAEGYRLTRYCDDFVIACRSESEARDALDAARSTMENRRLRIHRDKTRLVAPGEEFDFLGYHFASDGSVIAPPSATDAMARQVVRLARSSMKRASTEIASTPQRTRSAIKRIKSALRSSK